MVRTQKRKLAHLAILTACLLITAFWVTQTSRARSEAKRQLRHAGTPTPSESVAHVTTEELSRPRGTAAYGKLPLSFEINQGQTNGQVKFLSRGSGYNLFLTSTEAVLSLHQRGADDKASNALRIRLVAANPHVGDSNEERQISLVPLLDVVPHIYDCDGAVHRPTRWELEQSCQRDDH